MADSKILDVIIGHLRFTCKQPLDWLDFIFDITLKNLIFLESANMLINLIFSTNYYHLFL